MTSQPLPKNRTRWGDYIKEEKLELISKARLHKLFWEAETNARIDDVPETAKEYAVKCMEFLEKRINDIESETTVIIRTVEPQHRSWVGDD